MEALALALFALFLGLNVYVLGKARSVSVFLLMGLSYNYLLHGYVIVFLHETLGFSFGGYWYDGFPYFISYDRHFWAAVLVSLVFADTYLIAWVTLLVWPNVSSKPESSRVYLRGWPLLALGAVSFITGMMPWVDIVVTYLSDGESAYLAFKSGEQLGAYGGLLKLLLSIASMCLCILAITGIGISENLKIRPGQLTYIFWGLVCIGGMLFFSSMMALGDRVIFLEGGLAAVALASFHGVRAGRAICLLLVLLIPLSAIGVFREMKDSVGLSEVIGEAVSQVVVNAESRTVFSQYIAMANRVEPYPGGSFTYLGHILVPRFISEDRPDDGPYEHFAAAAGLPSRTGWGMNLMTDLYVNYGMLASAIGGLLLGTLHWAVFRFACVSLAGQFIFAGLISAYPLCIRSGIPGLKGMAMSMGLGYLFYVLSSRGMLSKAARA